MLSQISMLNVQATGMYVPNRIVFLVQTQNLVGYFNHGTNCLDLFEMVINIFYQSKFFTNNTKFFNGLQKFNF